MSTGVCRSVSLRNSSSSVPSNQTNISDAEWVTNSISLIIFLVAFVGNTAALIVMFASRGPIRLTNNKYLANLACADLLRACFIPFTIIARMKRNFIFGRIICKILPIVQGKRHRFVLISMSEESLGTNLSFDVTLSMIRSKIVDDEEDFIRLMNNLA